MLLRRVSLAALFGLVFVGAAAAQTDDYAWAGACKTCHTKQYDAWEKTKHAHAIVRLSGSERDTGGKCIGCHVTGPKELLPKDANANIQCEQCHGAGRKHIEAAAAGEAKPAFIVKKPQETVCTGCHNDTGPHFKFFSYVAMEGLVHQVPK